MPQTPDVWLVWYYDEDDEYFPAELQAVCRTEADAVSWVEAKLGSAPVWENQRRRFHLEGAEFQPTAQ